MLDDDDEGDGDLHRDEERGAVAADQEGCKQGKAGCAEDGGQRDVAANGENEEEDRDGGQSGVAARKTPKPVETPLPPRKRSQTGKTWPRTATSAARASTL
jgi:hypothetical protein